MTLLVPSPPGALIRGTIRYAQILQRAASDAGKGRPVVIWRDRTDTKIEIVGLTTVSHHDDGTPRTPIVHWALAGLREETYVWATTVCPITIIPRDQVRADVVEGILEPCDLAAIERLIVR